MRLKQARSIIVLKTVFIAAFILGTVMLIKKKKTKATELSLTADSAYAYLQELIAHKDEIEITEVDGRVDLNGNGYLFSDTAVSFYDLNGDGITEMLYQYHTSQMFGTSCRIVSFQNDGLVPITDENGEDLWVSGAATGNYAVLFTVEGNDHLFIKTGTVTGGVTYDNVSEYELIGNKLYLTDYYLIQRLNREPFDGEQPWTYSIYGEDSTKETLEDLYHSIFSNLDKVLINKLNFYIWEPTISDQDCISMTYDMAVEELSALIPEEYLMNDNNVEDSLNHTEGYEYYFVVNSTNGVELKREADYFSFDVLDYIPEGTQLLVEEISFSHAYVEYNGQYGWVSMSYLQPAEKYYLQTREPAEEDTIDRYLNTVFRGNDPWNRETLVQINEFDPTTGMLNWTICVNMGAELDGSPRYVYCNVASVLDSARLGRFDIDVIYDFGGGGYSYYRYNGVIKLIENTIELTFFNGDSGTFSLDGGGAAAYVGNCWDYSCTLQFNNTVTMYHNVDEINDYYNSTLIGQMDQTLLSIYHEIWGY